MSKCKFCQKDILWEQNDGRNVPKNSDGSMHYCRIKPKIGKLLYLPIEEANSMLGADCYVYLNSFSDISRARPMFVVGERK